MTAWFESQECGGWNMVAAYASSLTSRVSAIVTVLIAISMIGTVFIPDPSEGDAPGETVLRMGFLQKVQSLNPNQGYNEVSFIFYGLVYDCLQTADEDLNSAPNLALGWGIAEDFEPHGSVWDYNLTQNAHWHDGEPLTADDVVFTLNLNCQNYMTMWSYQPYAYYMQYAEKLDDYTVRVHFFDRDTGDPMSVAYGTSLFMPILPKHMLQDMTPAAISFNWLGCFEDMNPPIVGTGPFMATEDTYQQWLEVERLTLVRNPYYHSFQDRGESIKFDKIEMVFYDDATAMALALENGELDVARLPPAEYLYLKNRVQSGAVQNIETFEGPRCDQYWTNVLINFNDAGPNPSRLDPVIRQAMAMATNKDYINDNQYLGLGEPGTTLVSPVSEDWHYEPTAGELYEYDLTAAAALLEAGGYRYTNDSPEIRVCTADSYAVQAGLVPEGMPLEYEMAVRQEQPEEKDIAQYLEWEWAKVGIEIHYSIMTEAALGNLVYSYEYDTAIWCWASDPDPNYILFCQSEAAVNGWNDNKYENADYEQSYFDSVQELDVGLREAYVDDCQRIHYLDVGYIILNYVYQTYAWRTDTFTGWGDWAAEPGRSIDASWGANPLYFDLTPFGYVPPEDACLVRTTADLTGTKGDNGWYVSDVTVELAAELVWDDTTAPMTSATLNGTPGDNGWYLSPVTVELSAIDNSGDVESTYYSLNGNAWHEYVAEFEISEEGVNVISYYSVDGAGNAEEERTSSVKIDGTSPTVVIDVLDGFEFESSTVMIELNCSDNTSGVWQCLRSLDGGDYVPCDDEAVILYGLADGNHVLYVMVLDEAGNDANDSLSFRVNATSHASERHVDYYWYDLFAHPIGEWYDWRNLTYGGDWIVNDEYPYLCGWESYPPGNTMTYAFMRLSVDATNITEVNMVGNPEFLPLFSDETVRGGMAVIDWHLNYITYDEGDAKLPPVMMPWFDGWFVALNGSVVLDEQAAKAVLGITSAEFVDFDSWWAANQADVTQAWEDWMVHEAGPERLDIFWMFDYPLQFAFFDMDAMKVGNSVIVSMDTISWGMEALMTRWLHEAFMPTEWYMEDMSFHAEIGPANADIVIDAAVASSVFAYESIVDGSPCWAWEAMLQDYVLSGTPPYENLSLFDRYWNWSDNDLYEFYNLAPGSDWSHMMLPYDYTPGAWNLSANETLTFSWPEGDVLFFVHDPGNTSGLVDDTSEFWSEMTVEYMEPMPSDAPDNVAIDTEARLVTFTGPFDVWTWSKEQSTHEWLADEWDRIEMLPYGIPYIQFKATDYVEPMSLACDDNLEASASISLSAGADYTYYRLDGGDWELYSGPFVISEDGEHVLKRYSVDTEGNVEDVRTLEIKIDKTAPELTLLTDDGARFSADEVNISWACSDACSGVGTVEYSVDGGAYVECTVDAWVVISGLTLGEHVMVVRAYDEAGNSEAQTLTFTVEPGNGSDISDLVLPVGVAAACVAGAIAVLALFAKRKRAPGGED
jgi:peptide/nickel transport system substrate-binding protein